MNPMRKQKTNSRYDYDMKTNIGQLQNKTINLDTITVCKTSGGKGELQNKTNHGEYLNKEDSRRSDLAQIPKYEADMKSV